jgi:3-hydroxyacyl-CoA dehydrogenase/enoyl-CoA hydratase/3-hydroxybutyryl-CoA epimerase
MMESRGTARGARLASDAVGISLDVSDDGLATIEFDLPGLDHNRLSPDLIARFVELVEDVHGQAEEGSVRGLVIASSKPGSFIAGLDVAAIAGIRGVTAARAGSRQGQLAFQALADLPVPTVAAINGTCVGGGTELALACDYRVASDSRDVQIGLPEVQLGIIPGFGGTQRLPRVISLERALALILSGRSVDARRAVGIGLVDAAVPPPMLMREAVRHALSPPGRRRRAPEDRPLPRRLRRWLLEGNPLGRALLFRRARAGMLAATGGHYPAPPAALDAVRGGLRRGVAAGLRLEADIVADVVVSLEARNLIGIFFLRQAARRGTPSAQVPAPRRLGVVGAGVMGGGIAQQASYRGLEVRLKDISSAPLLLALQTARRRFGDLQRRRRLSAADVRRGMERISATTDYTGFGQADVVVEAVVENLAIKHEVLAALEQVVGEKTVLATNTSSLTVASIATALTRPERFVGMHFFNPVHRMPLVEVVKGPESSPLAVETVRALVMAMGKVPIVVGDAPGFFVNRVLAPYLNEALALVAEGAGVKEVDAALRSFGMPMGPLRLLDEIGLDVAAKVTAQMGDAAGHRPPGSDAAERLVASGRLGRKGGAGFYRYPGRKEPVVDPQAEALVRGPAAAVDSTWIVDRCILAMLNEAAVALEQGVVSSAPAADLALVLGLGFAPFRGGVFRYAEERGVEAIRDRMAELEAKCGPRYACAAALAEREFYPTTWPERVESL